MKGKDRMRKLLWLQWIRFNTKKKTFLFMGMNMNMNMKMSLPVCLFVVSILSLMKCLAPSMSSTYRVLSL